MKASIFKSLYSSGCLEVRGLASFLPPTVSNFVAKSFAMRGLIYPFALLVIRIATIMLGTISKQSDLLRSDLHRLARLVSQADKALWRHIDEVHSAGTGGAGINNEDGQRQRIHAAVTLHHMMLLSSDSLSLLFS